MRMRLLAPLALAAALLASACRSAPPARPFPHPESAAALLAEARDLERSRPPGWFAAAEAACASATQLAPGWVAPRRMADELARLRLDAHGALARRRADLLDGADAAELYLVGRLEGEAGGARFARALELERSLAWAHHGQAWWLARAGPNAAAVRAAGRARALAAGSYELGFFALAEARLLRELERVDEAGALLESVLADARLVEPERSELAVFLTELELADARLADRGLLRGRELLARPGLAPAELERLGSALCERGVVLAHPDPAAAWLAALAEGESEATRAARERLRLRLLVERGERGLAEDLAAGGPLAPPRGAFQRVRDFERGAGAAALERWLADLPRTVLDERGLPRSPALAHLLEVARAADAPGRARRLGEALLEAGWFDEAAAQARVLAAEDGAAARDLRRRAAEGQALLAEVRAVLLAVDLDEPLPGLERARRVRGLDELLAALEPAFRRHLHDETLDLCASPRLSFGGLAEVVHPGPTFSEADERAGLGRAGEAVPGLAAALARLGRFGLFGRAPGGGGPDGTVLRTLALEWRSGAHLGVPFAGLVAWCEGADVPSRPARVGAEVSGAALHEGFWVDVEGVRAERARLERLAEELAALPAGALAAALNGRGVRLVSAAELAARTGFVAPLGEGQRVFAALLQERAGALPTLEELLDNTAHHEEGHLTERTRFLPLARRWPAVLAFALRHGLAPRAIARALEYRAQLVALCTAAEPRLVLADCLAAAEDTGGYLAHGEAYRELVEDLLVELADAPELAREHLVLHQLHFLSAESVRAAALRLARREGLVAGE